MLIPEQSRLPRRWLNQVLGLRQYGDIHPDVFRCAGGLSLDSQPPSSRAASQPTKVLREALSRYQARASFDRVNSQEEGGALAALSWSEFEALIGEGFRRRGFSVSGNVGPQWLHRDIGTFHARRLGIRRNLRDRVD